MRRPSVTPWLAVYPMRAPVNPQWKTRTPARKTTNSAGAVTPLNQAFGALSSNPWKIEASIAAIIWKPIVVLNSWKTTLSAWLWNRSASSPAET